ncbi:MAG: glycosyltransferase family 4 protein [Anaerovibrio sp.]
MKVLFDGICITKNPAGIGNYAYQLLQEFVADNRHEVTVISHNPDVIPKSKNINVISPKNYRYEQLLPFDFLSRYGKYDVYHQPNYIPHCFKGKRVVTVHDMSCKVYAQYHPWERVALFRLFSNRMKNADAILTVSNSSKQEIIDMWKVPENKVHVTYLGVDDRYYGYSLNEADEKTISEEWNIPDNYILFVGTIEPRKNVQRLIKAFNMYKSKEKDDLKLVLAGGKGWLSEDIYKEAEISKYKDDILFTGYIPESLKPALYAKAKAMVYPSLYEGFGLPVLEAMAVGTQVVTSSVSSMPEVAGGVGIYIDPLSEEDICCGISRAIFEGFSAEKIVKRARLFSWKKCYRETVDYYQR